MVIEEGNVVKKAFLITAGLLALGIIGVFLLIQLIPYGRAHANPPVVQEPPWDSPATRALAKRACFDCHSNETVWPFYSNIAPLSWLVQRDVDEGRAKLNFSEWGMGSFDEPEEIVETVQEGEMPLRSYLLMHPEANLSRQEREALLQGLRRTFGGASGENSRDDD